MLVDCLALTGLNCACKENIGLGSLELSLEVDILAELWTK